MEEIEIIETIKVLINDFQRKYNENPNYIKMPLWVKIKLREYCQNLLTSFNYEDIEEKEDFRIFNLLICETITIQRLDEMEVF